MARFLKTTNVKMGVPGFKARGTVRAPKLSKTMGSTKMKPPKAVHFKTSKIKI